jgi:hypothetical protein
MCQPQVGMIETSSVGFIFLRAAVLISSVFAGRSKLNRFKNVLC